MGKQERELRRLAKRLGLRVDRTSGSHFRLLDALGGVVAVTAGTPSDHRGMKNLEADLKRRLR